MSSLGSCTEMILDGLSNRSVTDTGRALLIIARKHVQETARRSAFIKRCEERLLKGVNLNELTPLADKN